VRIFLGGKWLPAAEPLRILAAYGALRAVEGSTGAVFVALGRPELRTRLQLAQLCILAAALYPLTSRFGISGAAAAMLLYAAAINPLAVAIALRIVKAPWGPSAAAAGYALLLALGLEAVVFLAHDAWGAQLSLARFLLTAVMLLLCFAAGAAAGGRMLGYGGMLAAWRGAGAASRAGS